MPENKEQAALEKKMGLDTSKDYNLDVASPEEVPEVLRRTAEHYMDSASDLEGAWQDKKAGKIWLKIGYILDSAADKIEAHCKKHGA